MVKKTFCVFYIDNMKFEDMLNDAVNSFKMFHTNLVDIFIIKNYNGGPISDIGKMYAGIAKYEVAYRLWDEKKYKKCIILGADTITCSRLDEFLDDDYHDMLLTLDYAARLCKNRKTNEIFNMVNADVVCFNNKKVLPKILDISPHFTLGHEKLCEQGALNEVVISGEFSWFVVDEVETYYNVRAKGRQLDSHIFPKKEWLDRWYVNDGKLFAGDDRQIKIFHYCCAFGAKTLEEIDSILEKKFISLFNNETLKFFKEKTGSDKFRIK